MLFPVMTEFKVDDLMPKRFTASNTMIEMIQAEIKLQTDAFFNLSSGPPDYLRGKIIQSFSPFSHEDFWFCSEPTYFPIRPCPPTGPSFLEGVRGLSAKIQSLGMPPS